MGVILKCFLDGDEYTLPLEWGNFTTSIKRDDVINGLFEKNEQTFTFYDDAYQYLKNIFDSDSFCNAVELVITGSVDGDSYDNYFIGEIHISDITFDEKRLYAKTKIQDNSFYAKINNNRAAGSLLHVPKSKAGDTISAATITTMKVFAPTTGAYYSAAGVRGGASYRVYDAFEYLINFMTDGTVGFASDSFDVGGDWDGLVITMGYVLKYTTVGGGLDQDTFETNWQVMDFETLFKEVDKKINIGFTVEFSGTTPTIRIETKDYFYTNSVSFTATDVDELATKTATEKLFAKLLVGSEDFLNSGEFTASVGGVGFKDEEYTATYQCNINSELDLVGDWIVDSNTIEDAVVQQATDYDDKFFLIKCTNISGVYYADQANWLTGAPPSYFYNYDLINSKCIERHREKLYSPLALYLSSTDNTFSSNQGSDDSDNATGPATVTYQLSFDNELTDPSNNYTPGTTRYVAPETGTYNFSAQGLVYMFMYNYGVTESVNLELYLDHYNGAGTLLFRRLLASKLSYTNTVDWHVPIAGSVYSVQKLSGTVAEYLPITHEAGISMDITPSQAITYHQNAGGYFRCDASPSGGGTIVQANDDNAIFIRHEFETAMTEADYKTIKGSSTDLIEFYRAGNPQKTKRGWIEELKYNHVTGAAKFTLISNKIFS